MKYIYYFLLQKKNFSFREFKKLSEVKHFSNLKKINRDFVISGEQIQKKVYYKKFD